jgi:hypothetical protein
VESKGLLCHTSTTRQHARERTRDGPSRSQPTARPPTHKHKRRVRRRAQAVFGSRQEDTHDWQSQTPGPSVARCGQRGAPKDRARESVIRSAQSQPPSPSSPLPSIVDTPTFARKISAEAYPPKKVVDGESEGSQWHCLARCQHRRCTHRAVHTHKRPQTKDCGERSGCAGWIVLASLPRTPTSCKVKDRGRGVRCARWRSVLPRLSHAERPHKTNRTGGLCPKSVVAVIGMATGGRGVKRTAWVGG